MCLYSNSYIVVASLGSSRVRLQAEINAKSMQVWAEPGSVK